MDSLVLWLVGMVCRKRAKLWRLLLAGAAMALLYCLMILFFPLYGLGNLCASVIMVTLGIQIAFRPRHIKEFGKLVAFAYLGAFFMGGLGMALFYLTDLPQVVGNMVNFGIENFSLKLLLSSACGFFILFKLFYSRFSKYFNKKQTFYDVHIYCEGNKTALHALLDTGNSLYDPISKEPVIIAEFDSIKSFLPDKLQILFYEHNEGNLARIALEVENSFFIKRIRMIPFTSLGKQNGMLIGFKPDKVEIVGEQTLLLENVIIGIYNTHLSGDGAYQGLLHPELIG